MKQKRVFGKIVPAALVLIFLIYLGAQAYNNLSEPIVTIDATLITAEDKISTDGFFMRNETLVMGNPGSVEYMFADGEKIGNGQAVAMFFTGDSAAQEYQELLRINDEIASLVYVKNSLSGDATGAKIDTLIYSSMLDISQVLSDGSVAAVSGDMEILQQLVANRNSIRSDNNEFQVRIDELEAQKNSILYKLSSQSTSIYAQNSGYFFSGYDGYETVLKPEDARSMTPARVESLSPGALPGGIISGTLVTGYEWFYITTVSSDDAARLRSRRTVDIRFSQIESKLLNMEVDYISEVEDGRAVLILRSQIMDEKYLRERMQSGEIVLTSYSGIKVPTEALRMENDEWGVYCLEGNVIRFKKIDWIYQADSFYIVPSSNNPKKELYIYDKIVVSGKGLEGGSVIN